MSDLMNRLETFQLNRRAYDLLPLRKAIELEDFTKQIDADLAWEYRIGVRLQMKGFVRTPEQLAELKKHAREAIIHDVYGEFKRPLIDLRYAIWERNFDKANGKADEILARMFS
jgi:hypothetical protein